MSKPSIPPAQADAGVASLPSLLDARLLLVDDDPAAIQMLSRVLAGYSHLRFATNGADALRVAAEWSPEIVLLDAEMPGLSGFDVLKRLKADPQLSSVPVIFVTQHSDAQTETMVFEMGAADFITKPVTGPALRARVAMHLRLRRITELLAALQTRDGLTGLANRQRLDHQLGIECARAQRGGQALALLLLQVDFLNAYRQIHGDAQGEQVLRQVAALLSGLSHRPADLGARLDADTFALLLPQTDADGASDLAVRLVDGVRAMALPHPASPACRHVTISVGLAVLPGPPHAGGGIVDAALLIAEANAALADAHSLGHDRCAMRLALSAAALHASAIGGPT